MREASGASPKSAADPHSLGYATKHPEMPTSAEASSMGDVAQLFFRDAINPVP